jgi:hypothetical protein
MKKSTIVQFVCFVTNLELDEFTPKWERYAKRLKNLNPETTLLQQVETKSKFRYISQHEWLDKDFHFTFMNEKRSEHFPEHNVKVVQIGGYTLLQAERRNHIDNSDSTRLIVFISHEENDIDFYRELPLYGQLNVYQPYYESCSYGYVLEFFVPDIDADELAKQLKQRRGVEIGMYKECMMFQL